MKPYGFKSKIVGEPNWWKHDSVRMTKKTSARQAAKRSLRKFLFYSKLVKCDECSDIAVWRYEPAGVEMNRCEAHVPRGCSCQEDPDEPCCEWMYYYEGYENE